MWPVLKYVSYHNSSLLFIVTSTPKINTYINMNIHSLPFKLKSANDLYLRQNSLIFHPNTIPIKSFQLASAANIGEWCEDVWTVTQSDEVMHYCSSVCSWTDILSHVCYRNWWSNIHYPHWSLKNCPIPFTEMSKPLPTSNTIRYTSYLSPEPFLTWMNNLINNWGAYT